MVLDRIAVLRRWKDDSNNYKTVNQMTMKCFEKMKELELYNMAYIFTDSHYYPLLSIPETIFHDVVNAYMAFITKVYEYVKADQDFLCQYLFTTETEIAFLNRIFNKHQNLLLYDGRERVDEKKLGVVVYRKPSVFPPANDVSVPPIFKPVKSVKSVKPVKKVAQESIMFKLDLVKEFARIIFSEKFSQMPELQEGFRKMADTDYITDDRNVFVDLCD